VDESAHACVTSLAVGVREVDGALLPEKEVVGHAQRVLGMVGEAVDAVVGTPLRLAVDLVEALEQPAVEERDGTHQRKKPLWVGEQVFVAVEVRDAAMGVKPRGVAFAEAALVLLLVERRKKEVLQDGFVEARLLAGSERFAAFQQGRQFAFFEQRVGDEPFRFEEPAEQQARD
jgi:hypothetical protein